MSDDVVKSRDIVMITQTLIKWIAGKARGDNPNVYSVSSW